MSAGLVLLEDPGESLFPCLSSSQRMTYFIGYWFLSMSKASDSQLSLSHNGLSLVLILLSPFSPFEDSCMFAGPTRITPYCTVGWLATLFHLQTSYPLAMQQHFYRFQGPGCGLLWGPIIVPTVSLIMHNKWLLIHICVCVCVCVYVCIYACTLKIFSKAREI